MSSSEGTRRPTRQSGPTVEQARAFVAVADASSYRQAAEHLALDEHATLVRLVGRFTKALPHGRLVEQESKGRVRLTPAGERVLPVARGLIDSADELMEMRPEIRFSAYPTIAARMAERCSTLLEQDVPLVLRNVSEANRQDGGWTLVHDVATGRLDMAIAPAGLEEERLTERFLYSWQLRVIFPGKRKDEHVKKLRHARSVTPRDISDFRIAVAPTGHKSRELLREAFRKADEDLSIALESPNQDLLRAVAQGGEKHVAVIPEDAFFGQKEVQDAPFLSMRRNGKTGFGGDYALYMRRREEEHPDDPISEHDAAIDKAADLLVEKLRL